MLALLPAFCISKEINYMLHAIKDIPCDANVDARAGIKYLSMVQTLCSSGLSAMLVRCATLPPSFFLPTHEHQFILGMFINQAPAEGGL